MMDFRATFLVTVLLFPCCLTSGSAADFVGPISDVPGAPLAPGSPSIPATSSQFSSPKAISVSTGFDGSEPVLPGGVRINRNGVASTCSGKAFPGTFGSAGNLYDTFVFQNNGPERCVTVNFNTGTCGTSAHATAYAGSFNPNNLSQNYLGDVGSSLTQPFSFIAPANSSVVIVINTNFGPTVCNYSFSSPELDASAVSTSAIPTLQEWALLLMGLLLGGLIWHRSRRKGGMAA